MAADAGFVRLHLVEALLRIGEWAEAASIAGAVADLFTRNGARLHVMRALAYLRDALSRHVATPKLA
jgi:hypothetical protein